jgi:CRISPR/Cas system CSM-associated protein Csm2 small subunit
MGDIYDYIAEQEGRAGAYSWFKDDFKKLNAEITKLKRQVSYWKGRAKKAEGAKDGKSKLPPRPRSKKNR